MTDDNWLSVEDHGDGIFGIALNRPPVNALSPAALMAFAELLDELSEKEAVKAVLLTSPLKVFSAGLDLKEAQKYDLDDQRAIVRGLNIAFTKLYAFPKPTVAAVNGAAIAGGFFFVLASDCRIAVKRASFGLAEVRVGADFPVGPMEIARATLSANDLRRLMLSGAPINAQAALTAGIVDKIVEDEELLSEALAVAKSMSSSPPKTYAAVKRQIRGATIDLIESAMGNGANAPQDGWFNSETKAAMARMVG